jgi:hypothetical protein
MALPNLVQKQICCQKPKMTNGFWTLWLEQVVNFFFFPFERVIEVVERMLTLFKLTSFSYERHGQKCNSWQKSLQKKQYF